MPLLAGTPPVVYDWIWVYLTRWSFYNQFECCSLPRELWGSDSRMDGVEGQQQADMGQLVSMETYPAANGATQVTATE
jgi:hypothetical protein